ncbi:MAG TPA: MFS transporter [Clostridia bacterium]|nr:MFS transporter [Clostridia bacterium]
MKSKTESKISSRPHALRRVLSFWSRQDHDWKVTVARSSLERFGYQMIVPYLSIYIVALGASKTQLGLVNSISMVIAGLLGPLTGVLIDRSGPKKVYLFGISMLMTAYLIYVLAPNWLICTLAMTIYWIGQGSANHSCATICGNCLRNEDRAKGMLLCETLAAGFLGIAGPMIAALLVAHFGGVNITGIRPLFYVAITITSLSFILVVAQLSNRQWLAKNEPGRHLIMDGIKMLKGNRDAQKWLLIGALNNLPYGMILPFTQVFAREAKGASGYILGAMVTGTALTSIIFGLPAGIVADRIGRKKALYILIPLFWVANITLILAPSPAFLILSGILFGFYYIIGPITGAIEMELVPADQMGRWIGINRLIKALSAAGMALVGGLIWDKLGPPYVFLIYVGIDLVLRIPLLVSMPETLINKTAP